jgi:hypothetical protein
MDEARVVIKLKEGIIELEGPVDFVRHYLDMYQPAMGLPEDISVSKARKRKVVPGPKAEKEKRVSCGGAILTALEAGFFDEPRSSTEVRQRLNETGLNFTDNNVRNSLIRLAKSGSLGVAGRGRYCRPDQS